MTSQSCLVFALAATLLGCGPVTIVGPDAGTEADGPLGLACGCADPTCVPCPDAGSDDAMSVADVTPDASVDAGACADAAPPDASVCRGTLCQTSQGLRCVDTRADPNNCFACGNVCSSGVCTNSVCETASIPDAGSDTGQLCDVTCPAGFQCTASGCQIICDPASALPTACGVCRMDIGNPILDCGWSTCVSSMCCNVACPTGAFCYQGICHQ